MLRRPCIKFRPQFLNLCIFNFCFPWNLPLCASKDVLCRESNIHRISALMLYKWLSGSSICSLTCQKPRKYMVLLLLGISWSTVWRYKMFEGIRILLIKNKMKNSMPMQLIWFLGFLWSVLEKWSSWVSWKSVEINF